MDYQSAVAAVHVVCADCCSSVHGLIADIRTKQQRLPGCHDGTALVSVRYVSCAWVSSKHTQHIPSASLTLKHTVRCACTSSLHSLLEVAVLRVVLVWLLMGGYVLFLPLIGNLGHFSIHNVKQIAERPDSTRLQRSAVGTWSSSES